MRSELDLKVNDVHYSPHILWFLSLAPSHNLIYNSLNFTITFASSYSLMVRHNSNYNYNESLHTYLIKYQTDLETLFRMQDSRLEPHAKVHKL
jgi:hypothetical protein